MSLPPVRNDDTPGHLARRFQQIAVAAFQSEMEAIGCDITPVQFAALSALVEHPGIDQATLAARIALDRATMTGVVGRLEAKGLVSREVCVSDRRARKLELTSEGLRTLDLIGPSVDRAQRQIVRKLSEDETAEFMRLLRKAVDQLN